MNNATCRSRAKNSNALLCVCMLSSNISNIKPVRDVLRHSSDREGCHTWFPYVPWKRSASGKVAVGADGNKHASGIASASLSNSHRGGQGRLEPIINSPPLLKAFDSFCQKALCGEVRAAQQSVQVDEANHQTEPGALITACLTRVIPVSLSDKLRPLSARTPARARIEHQQT